MCFFRNHMHSLALMMSYVTFALRLIIGICPTPSDPQNGKLGQKVSLDKRFLDGDEATFSCNRGYDLIGKKKLRCVGKVWDFGEPECKGEKDPACCSKVLVSLVS